MSHPAGLRHGAGGRFGIDPRRARVRHGALEGLEDRACVGSVLPYSILAPAAAIATTTPGVGRADRAAPPPATRDRADAGRGPATMIVPPPASGLLPRAIEDPTDAGRPSAGPEGSIGANWTDPVSDGGRAPGSVAAGARPAATAGQAQERPDPPPPVADGPEPGGGASSQDLASAPVPVVADDFTTLGLFAGAGNPSFTMTSADTPADRAAPGAGAGGARPTTAGERPAIRSALRYGEGDEATVLIKGEIATDAPAGAAFEVGIWVTGPGEKAATFAGSTRAVKEDAGAVAFLARLPGEVRPGSRVEVRLEGGKASAAVAVRQAGPSDPPDCGCGRVLRPVAANDRNRDGVDDAAQPGVRTLAARSAGRADVTLDARGRRLEGARALDAPGGNARLPFGMFAFEIHDVEPGGAAAVDVYLPEGARPGGYAKLDPATGAVTPFDFDGTTGAVVNGDIVTLHFVDGGRGDADGEANGVIVDPGGPTGRVQIVDDGGPGWSASPANSWAASNAIVGYYGTGYRSNQANGAGEFVEYTFAVTPGRSYAVAASWTASSNRTTTAPFTFYDGTSPIGGVSANQTTAPNDFASDGVWWEELSPGLVASSGTLKVRLAEPAAGISIADAVRIEEVDDACRSVLDVMLVLDGSGSISAANFATMKTFAHQLVAEFDVAADAAKIGIVQFAAQGTWRREIGLSGDASAIGTAINAMTQIGSGTDIQEGLERARLELASAGRPGVPSVVILLTDGEHNQPGDPVAEATLVKAPGTRLYAVGVGSGINTTQLNAIASDPDADHVFLASSFSTLLDRVEQIASTVCSTQAVGSISGAVYADLGNDGLRKADEPGVGGASVLLEGTDDRGRAVRRRSVTEGDGSFRFDQLWPGNYIVGQLQPAGYLDGKDTVGDAGGVAQDDRFTSVRVRSGEHARGYLFGEHRAPAFSSTPILDVLAGKPYAYDADAVDPDGDTVSYTLLSGPAGLTISASTGLISWSPTTANVGAHAVSIRAADGRGGAAAQDFTIRVLASSPNRPPRFTSEPVVDADIGASYAYQASAFDPDADPLGFALVSGPAGLTVSPVGLVQWTPPASLFAQLDQASAVGASGTQQVAVPVTINVSDGRGGVDTQPYTILVRPRPEREPNRPPVIVSDPVTTLRLPDDGTYPTIYHVGDIAFGVTAQGPMAKDLSNAGTPLTINGVGFAKGLGVTAGSLITINNNSIGGRRDDLRYRRFQSWIGVDDAAGANGRVVFKVWGARPGFADQLLYQSPELTGADPAVPIDVSLMIDPQTPYPTIKLQVVSPDAGTTHDHADWGDARMLGIPRRALGRMTVRDFRPSSYPGGHTDFQQGLSDPEKGLALPQLDADRKPVLNVNRVDQWGNPSPPRTVEGTASFAQWFRDVPGVNLSATLPFILEEDYGLNDPEDNILIFSDGDFFPIDQRLFGNDIASHPGHNYSFTAEFNASFVYDSTAPKFVSLASDDDSWLFIDGRLAIDLGGTHSAQSVYVPMATIAAALGLQHGQTYSLDLFYAERETGDAALTFQTDIPLFVRPYEYDVEALDPDGDVLTYELIGTVPSNLSIDPRNGFLQWRPGPLTPGSYPIGVRVSDGRGGVDIQQYNLVVTSPVGNSAPVFAPDLAQVSHRVNLGESYRYEATALDVDGDRLSYRLLDGPSPSVDPETGEVRSLVDLDPLTGTLSWTPTPAHVGQTLDLTVEVFDGRGGRDLQRVLIEVVRLTNADPVFATAAATSGRAHWLYRYDADATDADGNPIRYDLPLAPSGMVVHPETGVVAWVPRADQVGVHDVILRALDGQGGVALQSYQVTVSPPNRAPNFVSTPPAPAFVNRTYAYTARATDLDNDALTYSVVAPTPAAVSIHPTTGVLTWASPPLGTATIVVRASDNFGGTATQSFDLPVVANPGNRPPVITATEARTRIRAGRTYLFRATATDPDHDPLTYTLPAKPGNMALVPGEPGLVSWTPTVAELGSRSFTVTVSDGALSASRAYNVEVVNQDVNGDPSITSAPRTSAVVDRPYRYQLVGTDPDRDPILWSLEGDVPDGMTIDERTGLIVWTPIAEQVGPHRIRVRARDHLGGVSAPQSFTLRVRGANVPPRITSDPVVQARQNTSYSYQVRADDAEDDALSFALVGTPPSGMTINPTTGLIQWPASVPTGNYTVQVRADDDFGGTDTQSFTVEVLAALPNRPPTITSTPKTLAPTSAQYQYPVTATDPEGQAITFSVVAPSWLSYSAANLRIQGTPPAAGTYDVTVRATDTLGAWAEQRYPLVVRANAAPTIGPMAAQQVTAGQAFRFVVPATDPDPGDVLTYTLTSPPSGMTIDERGKISWTPAVAQVSATPYAVRVVARDPFGAASAEQSFNLTVVADTAPPVVDLRLSASQIEEGGRVTLLVAATDNVGVSSLSLTVGGTPVLLDGHGSATLTMPADGTFAVVAVARDAAGNQGTASANLVVLDRDNLAPTVALTGPADDGVVTAVVNVLGNISDDSYTGLKYTLTATPIAGGTPRTLASNVAVGAAISNGVLAQLDPTSLANGAYVLTLEATDAGQRTSRATRVVNVAGDLKLGNFRMSTVDLTVPVAGIPIVVSRSYDSLRANEPGEVGYGWRLDFGDMEVSVSRPDSSLGAFGDQVPFRDGTRVTVTGPDGRPQGFTFQPLPFGAFGLTLGYYINFVPDAGTTAFLTVPNQAQIQLTKAGNEYISLDYGGIPYNPADPAFGGTFDLTTDDGLAHTIDARDGTLLAMTDRLGNRLDFTYEGIVSPSGRAVTFERDPASGRITALRDPRGNRVRYGYSPAGDLVSVTDRLDNPPVQYVYDTNPARPHFLAEIKDPLGRQAARVQYDASNRVGTVTDAANKSLTNAYNPAARTQTTTDNDAVPPSSTTVTFSEHGDPTRVVDALNRVTKRTYAGRYLASETQVIGQDDGQSSETNDLTSTFTTDARGRVLTATDPAGRVTRMTYGPFGQPESVTDPAGLSTRNSYDGTTGNLLFTTDPTRQGTAFEYDPRGLVTKVTAGLSGDDWLGGGYGDRGDDGQPQAGIASTFAHNQFGDVVGSVDGRNVATTFTYDDNGNATGSSWTWVNPANPSDIRVVATTNEYDANDRLKRTVTPEGETRTEYDIFGRAWRTIDALGNRTETFYDARGLAIATREVDADDVVRSISGTIYDAQGRPIWADDPHAPGQPANVTETEYDALGRVKTTRRRSDRAITLNLTANPPTATLSTITGQILSTSTTAYDGAGRVLSTTDPSNVVTTFEYDRSGRQLAVVVTPPGMTALRSETDYDAAGRPVATRDPLLRQTRTHYDSAGRPYRTTFHDGTSTSSAFDDRGRRVAETDQAGVTIEYAYDDFGRLAAVVQPHVLDAGPAPDVPNVRPRYEYEYDAYGNLALIRDARGKVTRFAYDQHGRRTSRTLPLNQVESFQYDTLGRPSVHTDFKGEVTKTLYDGRGRVRKVEFYPNTTATVPTDSVTYTFDEYIAEGRRETTTDTRNPGTNERIYDREGRPIRATTPQGTIRYAYDALGRKTRTTTGANANDPVTDLRYTYDPLGRLKTVVAEELSNDPSVSLTTTYGYDAAGNLTSTALPNGTVETRAYDALNRLTLVEHAFGSTVLARFAYTLGPAGHRLAVDELGGRRVEYAYDALYRLTKETIKLNGTVSRTFSYTYDLVGNRMTRTDSAPPNPYLGTISYTYNDNDQMTREDATQGILQVLYTYNAAGEMIQRSESGMNSSTATYGWDIAGRMTSATIGGQGYSYRYDDEGMRVESKVGTAQPTKYLVDKELAYDQVLEEYAPGGALSATYVHGMDLLFQSRGAVRSYYHADGLGSVRALSSSAATPTVTDTWTYDAFGRELARTGTTANDYRYAGEQYDSSLKQTYLRARYYDAAAGRFTRMDSFEGRPGHPISMNKFIYANSDPANNIDPSGLSSFSLGSMLSAIGIGMNIVAILNDSHQALRAASQGRAADAAYYNFWLAVDIALLVVPFSGPFAGGGRALALAGGGAGRIEISSIRSIIEAQRAYGGIRTTYGGMRGLFAMMSAAGNGITGEQASDPDIITGKLTEAESNDFRENARWMWQEIAGLRAFWRGHQIHHLIPLEWSHVFPKQHPNRITNLAAVDDATHTLISNEWASFKRSLGGRTPTQREVLNQAADIESTYGNHYYYIDEWMDMHTRRTFGWVQ